MEYDPRRYSCGTTDRCGVIDRWSTETRRNYTHRDQQPTRVVIAGRGVPAPPPPPVVAPKPQRPTVNMLAQAVSSCGACAEEKCSSALCTVAAPGQVGVHRPPFHCYKVDSVNVLPPRPIREADDDVARLSAGQQAARDDGSRAVLPGSRNVQSTAPSPRGQCVQCVGCRYCHHDALHTAEGEGARRAEMFGLRREAAEHLRHGLKARARQAAKAKGATKHALGRIEPDMTAVQRLAPTPTGDAHAVPPTDSGVALPIHRRCVQLLSTNLFLCGSCGQVERRDDNENVIAHFLASPCDGCGVRGRVMRLIAEDCGRRGPHADPTEAPRPRTPFDDVADAVRLMPGGVVPMVERRTALGERIHVGRARVPSPARSALLTATEAPPAGGTIQRWLEEPLSANDSTKAKLCLTWGS